MNTPIEVVLVEDDTLLRDGLATYLKLVGFNITAVGDCLSLYSQLAVKRFDVAVIDLGLPDQAGEVLIDYLRRNTASAIIVITARDTLDTRVECYRVGADLFLGKPIEGRELAAAITSLAARRATADAAPAAELQATPVTQSAAAPAPSAVTPVIPATPDTWKFITRQRILISPQAIHIELTAKESHLLEMLTASAAGSAGTVARRDLLETLYRRQDDSADRALDTLVRRTRRTIEVATGSPAPILTEHSIGYTFAANIVVEG